MGLCIGHDSLFFKHAKAISTVLVAKDRVLGHNPVAALQLADSYYSRLWGPDRPAKPPKLPVARPERTLTDACTANRGTAVVRAHDNPGDRRRRLRRTQRRGTPVARGPRCGRAWTAFRCRAVREREFARLPGRFTLIGGSILSDADLSRALTIARSRRVIHCAVITAGTGERAATRHDRRGQCAGRRRDVARGRAARREALCVSQFGLGLRRVGGQVTLMDEDALRPSPVALYGLTKLAAETILPRIAATQGLGFTAARLGGVYGPWEYATGVRDTLSPMLQVLELAAAGTEAVLGPPWRGDYTLSRDIAAGLVAIADAPVLPRTVYNLATGRATTAEDWCRVLSPGCRRYAGAARWTARHGTSRATPALIVGRWISARSPPTRHIGHVSI